MRGFPARRAAPSPCGASTTTARVPVAIKQPPSTAAARMRTRSPRASCGLARMISKAAAVFLAGARIAEHLGRPSTPNDHAWIESFFGHLKGEFPHLEKIKDPRELEHELDRLRAHYNTVRTRAWATSPPTTSTTAAARPSEPRAEPGWPGRASAGLPPTVSFERIIHDRPPVTGYYDPELVHLVRHTSGRALWTASEGAWRRHCGALCCVAGWIRGGGSPTTRRHAQRHRRQKGRSRGVSLRSRVLPVFAAGPAGNPRQSLASFLGKTAQTLPGSPCTTGPRVEVFRRPGCPCCAALRWPVAACPAPGAPSGPTSRRARSSARRTTGTRPHLGCGLGIGR
jgi:Integrase core domain